MVTLVSLLHLKNAPSPIEVTLEGIVTSAAFPLYLTSTVPFISKSSLLYADFFVQEAKAMTDIANNAKHKSAAIKISLLFIVSPLLVKKKNLALKGG